MGRAKRNPSAPCKQLMGFAALYPSYKLSRSDYLLRHRIAGTRAELTCRRTVVEITSRPIEAMRRLGAGQRATRVASLHRSWFECPQQRTADAAKSCIGCHIIQRDLAGVRHGSHPEDGIALDGEQERISWLRCPRGYDFRRL